MTRMVFLLLQVQIRQKTCYDLWKRWSCLFRQQRMFLSWNSHEFISSKRNSRLQIFLLFKVIDSRSVQPKIFRLTSPLSFVQLSISFSWISKIFIWIDLMWSQNRQTNVTYFTFSQVGMIVLSWNCTLHDENFL